MTINNMVEEKVHLAFRLQSITKENQDRHPKQNLEAGIETGTITMQLTGWLSLAC